MAVDEYRVEIHLIRTGKDYHSDVYEKLVVNGEDTEIVANTWVLALRDWLNKEIELGTKARSMTSIEGALKDAGYAIAFIEQDYDFEYDDFAEEHFEHVIRHYKISQIPDAEKRFEIKRTIISAATSIVQSAVNSSISDLDMARNIETLLDEIRGAITVYEGSSASYRSPGYTTIVEDPKVLADNNKIVEGDRVEHNKFGIGRVLSVREDELDIEFPDRRRTLVKGFAVLRVIQEHPLVG